MSRAILATCYERVEMKRVWTNSCPVSHGNTPNGTQFVVNGTASNGHRQGWLQIERKHHVVQASRSDDRTVIRRNSAKPLSSLASPEFG